MKSILCDAQLLTIMDKRAHAVSKCELVLLTEVKIVESTHLCYHEVISVVISNCFRHGKKSRHGLCIPALSLSWLGIFRMVGVVSYKMFAMVVACKKEDG